jgi:oligopeptide/dipeptide ABC transporter ATP-binding protein
MYLGRVVELGATADLFGAPRHPYSVALLASVPRLVPGRASTAPAIAGDPPSPIDLPAGCRFQARCPLAQQVCREIEPALAARPGGGPHRAACHFAWTAAPAAHVADVDADHGTEGATA